MKPLIDIGVNFHAKQLEGLSTELIARACANGVETILATGTSLSASKAALDMARRHACVRATAGVHPHSAKDYSTDTHRVLKSLWQDSLVVAVGECGLDYNRMFSPKDAQRHAFEQHLAAAIELEKPLFLHCRDAFEDFHAMLKEAASAGVFGVVHCFTDGPEEAEAYLSLGFDIGVTGWVTDKARGTELRKALPRIPLDRLHLETDAPYLRPKNAGKARPYNEPALLHFVAKEVALLKGVDEAVVRVHSHANSSRLFKLSNSDGLCPESHDRGPGTVHRRKGSLAAP